MKTGQELALDATEKELKVLTRAAKRAKEETDEYMKIHTVLIAIRNEFVELINSDEPAEKQLDRLHALQKREKAAHKIRKKDFMKLLDKETETESKRYALECEVQMQRFQVQMRRP
jgi:hypothetical protein